MIQGADAAQLRCGPPDKAVPLYYDGTAGEDLPAWCDSRHVFYRVPSLTLTPLGESRISMDTRCPRM
jgi:hypothetical protein